MSITPAASIIIPAHNEASTIAVGLMALLEGASPDEFELVVVPNGCTDDTALVAEGVLARLGSRGRVISLAVGSKAAALRAGDRAATAFPRLYLDADVVCETNTARALVQALSRPGTELAVPLRSLDLSGSSALVQSYYRAWQERDPVRAELSGRGCYAFSRKGRGRFGEFPDVVADDYWAVRQVPVAAAVVVPAPVVIKPPSTLPDLMRVRTRVYRGNLKSGSPRESGQLPGSRLPPHHPVPRTDSAVFLALSALAKFAARLGVRTTGRAKRS